MFIQSFTAKLARGSSYIPTSEPYNYANCGLINIKHDDQECFKRCLRYHQTKQSNNDDRLSAFAKVEDTYNYSGFDFPFHFDDVDRFEKINKVSIFIYHINEHNQIVKERDGNHAYV